ncbi:uncharacterized protein LOC144874378 isoform X2 [Branchiostoma floridae x Branchiostoma japonicum]
MEVRRSPRKKSPSPISSSVYTTSSGSSDSSEEETQKKPKPKDRDYKPSHTEPSSSCSSASSTPKKKRRRKESPEKEETVRSESEDGSRSDPLELQSNLSGVPRKRNQLRSRQARWRKGLTEVAVRDYDHSMVKGFLKQVSARQRKNFSVESWDSDDISSDDDDDDDNSPLREEEEEEEVPVARVVPNETFIETLQRET